MPELAKPTPEELARREQMRDPEIFHREATSYDWRSVMDALAASQQTVATLQERGRGGGDLLDYPYYFLLFLK